jgi:hypothetical protein
MFPRTLPSQLLLNIGAAIAATIAITAVSITTQEHLPASLIETGSMKTIDIGIEHDKPLALSFEMSSLGGVAIVEIGVDGSERVGLSVPSSWIRREVRGAPIADVTSDEESFGFVRWSLPGSSSVSFRVPHTPGNVVLHNPSGVALKVNVTRVMLPDEVVERDVLLVQESSRELW